MLECKTYRLQLLFRAVVLQLFVRTLRAGPRRLERNTLPQDPLRGGRAFHRVTSPSTESLLETEERRRYDGGVAFCGAIEGRNKKD